MKGAILLAVLLVSGALSAQTIENPVKVLSTEGGNKSKEGVWYKNEYDIMYTSYETKEAGEKYLEKFFKDMSIDKKRPYKLVDNDYCYKTAQYHEIIIDWMPNGSGGKKLLIIMRN